jgi:hypothetical protein
MKELLYSQNPWSVWKILDSYPCWRGSEAFCYRWCWNLEQDQPVWASYALIIATGYYRYFVEKRWVDVSVATSVLRCV